MSHAPDGRPPQSEHGARAPINANPGVLLQLDGISMHYGKGETAITALAGVDLSVHEGELVAVMGASRP